jgi:hypothetical protein
MAVRRFVYESFNARNLTPEEVARTFIVPDEFRNLCANNHVVLMGPRGSGKTTMLKMLTLRALNSWRGRDADEFRKQINFTAIYVPTDIHWSRQLFHASDELGDRSPVLERKFSEVAVTTNILSAVCLTFRDKFRSARQPQLEQETKLCKALIKEWRLPPTLPLLDTIIEALAARLSESYILAERARMKKNLQDALEELPDYFSLDYLASVRIACMLFERIFEKGFSQKWALCFDELELAPVWLQDRLFAELRSTDERFLFKLSTSPLPTLGGIHEAQPTQDFGVIRLWSHSKSPRHFCEQFVEAILRRHYDGAATADRLFGSSLTSHTDDDKTYARGSFAWHLLRDLAEVDPAFREILLRNEISPADPFTEDIHKRDQILRKAKPLALQRLSFMKHDREGRVARRTRKIFNIYFGKEAVYDISDGNPRWLHGIVSDMLAQVKTDKLGRPRRLSKSVQERVLRDVSRQFLNFLESVPDSSVTVGKNRVDLPSLLKAIGAAFFKAIVVEPFSLDPFGSFKVDRSVPESLIHLIKLAAYHGAIVMVELGDWVYSDPRDRRFRPSYLLAPEFRLPLRLYKAAPLSRIVNLKVEVGRRRESRQAELPLRG